MKLAKVNGDMTNILNQGREGDEELWLIRDLKKMMNKEFEHFEDLLPKY
jgi:hypothetical protein